MWKNLEFLNLEVFGISTSAYEFLESIIQPVTELKEEMRPFF